MAEENDDVGKVENETPQSEDGSDVFAAAWNKVYSEAKLQTEDAGNLKQALGLLEAMTKLVFGGNTRQKHHVVTYGEGGLELTVSLVRKSNPDLGNEQTDVKDNDAAAVAIAGMKCVKTMVLRNPVGRSRCRSAGVFVLINDIFLSYSCEGGTSGKIIEENLTTLAAICMGDDLNALQAALTLSTHVDRAATIFGATGTNLPQVCTYLNALFDAISKEQAELKQRILAGKEGESGGTEAEAEKTSIESFFKGISAAEKKAREAEESLGQRKHELTEQHCSGGLETIMGSLASTKEEGEPPSALLAPLCCRLYELRAVARLSDGKFEDAIGDVDCFLAIGCKEGAKTQLLGAATIGRMHKVKAEALTRLGRVDEARESTGKAQLLSQSHSDTL